MNAGAERSTFQRLKCQLLWSQTIHWMQFSIDSVSVVGNEQPLIFIAIETFRRSLGEFWFISVIFIIL